MTEHEERRLLDGELSEDDSMLDAALRPRFLKNYVGQDKVKEPLSVFITAARERGEPLDHVLLHGPPGLGKTTLAHIIANELEASIRMTSGPAIERPGDLAAILTNLEPGGVLFIDEIHRLNRTVEEILYPAMEDYALDIIIGKGPSARSLRLSLPQFTLIGATTRAGLLTSPLRDRFGVVCRLDFYRISDLEEIVKRSAVVLGVELDDGGAYQIASRSRGTPRVANRLLRRLRDYAQVRAAGVITDQVAREGLRMLEVDDLGLDRLDRRLLTLIAERFRGGPVGLDTLAAALGEEAQTLEDVYEPYLLQIGFLQRTPRGRVISPEACLHLDIELPEQSDQPRLL